MRRFTLKTKRNPVSHQREGYLEDSPTGNLVHYDDVIMNEEVRNRLAMEAVQLRGDLNLGLEATFLDVRHEVTKLRLFKEKVKALCGIITEDFTKSVEGIKKMYEAGQLRSRIHAIKMVRELTGLELMESKNITDAWNHPAFHKE